MVCAFYKATAIYADTETEQTYCQSDDGNDVLCLMLTQVSECYFEIMEYHGIFILIIGFKSYAKLVMYCILNMYM